ncbi:MAG: D-aminoacylase, partial [bacterium]|nr:D-aminoacylase [bacterium]
ILSAIFTLFDSVISYAQYDYVIKNGKVVDGTGNPWYIADIGISGDKIVKIGRIEAGEEDNIIDASGKIVCPGFIDMHSHAERQILRDPTVHNMITQGNTTIVGGNCGGSQLDLERFFSAFEKKGASMNMGSLIGHNTIRRRIMRNEGREPTREELEKMKEYVEKGMQDGALGFSTGLKYRPGVYSKTGEIIELAKVASEYGGFYASHLRDEGLQLFESMDEAIRIGEEADIPVQMSHHKAAGADMWGQTINSLKKMVEARERGIEVTTDLHPYPATFTTAAILFPAWALEGSAEDINSRLNDPETRKRVIDGIVNNIIHDRGGNDIKNVTVAVHKADRSLEGLNLHEILVKKGRGTTMEDAAELLIELLMSDGGASCAYHCLSMNDIVRILQHPLSMYGSDAGNASMDVGKVHPRHYGHFPRIIAYHVRERGDLELEYAIKKMTSFPAAKAGIRNRGLLSEGKFADIVIFDYDRIQDKATFVDPHQYCEGIDYVMVNGEIVVDHGELTGKLPGKVIYGPGKK